jgi:hypothetical protein
MSPNVKCTLKSTPVILLSLCVSRADDLGQPVAVSVFLKFVRMCWKKTDTRKECAVERGMIAGREMISGPERNSGDDCAAIIAGHSEDDCGVCTG